MSLLGIQGERETGMDVREGNSMAVQSIANVVKSSLGPQGLDKMLVDETGEVVITNDGATILKLLSIEHPAAKILGDLAQIQDKEVGDGTTSVVILAAELLRRATQLIKNNHQLAFNQSMEMPRKTYIFQKIWLQQKQKLKDWLIIIRYIKP